MRTAKHCALCGKPVNPRGKAFVGLRNGEAYTWKLCADCSRGHTFDGEGKVIRKGKIERHFVSVRDRVKLS